MLTAGCLVVLAACGGDDDQIVEAPTPAEPAVTDSDLTAAEAFRGRSTRFRVTVRNTSDDPLGVGFWIRHRGPDPLFVEGRPDRGEGLESLVEDADARRLAESYERQIRLGTAGLFGVEDSDPPTPAAPGQAMVFELDAEPGESVTFVVPLGDVDRFVGPGGIGLALYDPTAAPISGDVTPVARVWDLGTMRDGASSSTRAVTVEPGVVDDDVIEITVEALD